jgi:hypothetical protein
VKASKHSTEIQTRSKTSKWKITITIGKLI